MLRSLLKNVLKNKLSPQLRHKLNKACALSLGFDQGPIYNMFHHISFLKKIGFDPQLIIDVGAYEGEWTKNVLEIFAKADFLMIEAQNSKNNILSDISKNHKNVHLEMCLLGENEKDNIEFYEMETGSSIYQENSDHARQKVTLKMTTLDNVLKKYNTSGKCFLKIDVQGAEIDVLKGASKILDNTEFLLLEVSTLNYNLNAPQFSDIVLFLEEKGFVLFDICDTQRTSTQVLFQMDILFIKKTSEIRKNIDFKSLNNDNNTQNS